MREWGIINGFLKSTEMMRDAHMLMGHERKIAYIEAYGVMALGTIQIMLTIAGIGGRGDQGFWASLVPPEGE